MRRSRLRRDRGVEAQHLGRHDTGRFVEAIDAGQERGNKVGARKHRRRRHGREQYLQQRRQRRIGHIVEELPIVLGLAGIEAILVRQADHQFIDQRHTEPRHLRPRAANDFRSLARRRASDDALGCRIEHARLTQAGRGPSADDRAAARGEARSRYLKFDRGDLLLCQRVRFGVRRTRRIQIDQIENLTEVDEERILTLADKHLARSASGNTDAGDVVIGVSGVVGNRFRPDVVIGLGEGGASRRRIGRLGCRPAAAVAAHECYLVGLGQVLAPRIGIDRGADRPDQGQRNRNALATNRQGRILVRVGEAKLEGQVFLAITVVVSRVGDAVWRVVDMDFVQGVRIEVEIIRTAARILSRNVIGDQGDITVAAGLVASKHVEIGAVNLRMLRDERRFAMTRCRSNGCCKYRRDGSRQHGQ